MHNAVEELNMGLPRTNPDSGRVKDLDLRDLQISNPLAHSKALGHAPPPIISHTCNIWLGNIHFLSPFQQHIKEEAENERMHLMTALELKEPGILFRGIILLAQGEAFLLSFYQNK